MIAFIILKKSQEDSRLKSFHIDVSLAPSIQKI